MRHFRLTREKSMPKEELESLKRWLQVVDARQVAFDDRQAKNEHNISEIKKKLDDLDQEHQHISERINVNTMQLTEIKSDVKPILEGINSLLEAVKIIGWLAKGIKWISVTIVGTGVIIYGWSEYIQQIFKSGN